MKKALLILVGTIVLMGLGGAAFAHEASDAPVVVHSEDGRIVEVVLTTDATEADMAALAIQLNAIEPSAE